MIAKKIIEYVSEEVWRQGHDIAEPDGLIRVSWMLEAWIYAMDYMGSFTLKTLANLGRLVEREKNKKGFRTEMVTVGNRLCPHPYEITLRLENWLKRSREVEPLDAYREFEHVHPFVDGNGRTGKIILNYLNGTLRNPLFPPNDFWGGKWIRNP